MADIKHKVERAAFGTAIDGILKYVNKDEADREKAFLKLVDLSEKFMGDTFLLPHQSQRRCGAMCIHPLFRGQYQGSGSADCVEAAAVHGLPCEPALQ